MTGPLRVQGAAIVDGSGEAVRLKGTNIGGWLNMENFITGYSGNESLMRAAVREVLGDDAYELFFERLLTAFFGEPTPRFLAELGLNCVRIPVNYRHFEDDAAAVRDHRGRLPPPGPGDRGLRARTASTRSSTCTRCPARRTSTGTPTTRRTGPRSGSTPTSRTGSCTCGRRIADRYKDNPWVAGYNPINEPADESRAVVGPFYDRLVDGHPRASTPTTSCSSTATPTRPSSTSSTSRGQHRLHPATTTLPGRASGARRRTTSRPTRPSRSSWSARRTPRETGTPICVGEFAPDLHRRRRDRRDARADPRRPARASTAATTRASSIWMYKDLGRQGLTCREPDSPYRRVRRRLRGQEDPARRGPVGQRRARVPEVTQPIQDLVAREFARLRPVPVGPLRLGAHARAQHHARPAAGTEYAELFRGLGDDELAALADSFAFAAAASARPCATSSRAAEMRAAVLHEPGAPLALEDLELEAPRAGELRSASRRPASATATTTT